MVGFEAPSPWVSWVVVAFVNGYAPKEAGIHAERDGFYADLSQALRAARAAMGFETVQVVGDFIVNLGADLGGTVEGEGILGPCLLPGGSRHCAQFLAFCESETLCVLQSFEPQDRLREANNWATWYHRGRLVDPTSRTLCLCRWWITERDMFGRVDLTDRPAAETVTTAWLCAESSRRVGR